MMKKLGLFTLLIAFLYACEKSDLSEVSPDVLPVVSAYLEAGQTPIVQITRQLAYGVTDSSALNLPNLAVYIESEGVEHLLTQNTEGAYIADNTWKPIAGKTYRLHFTYNNREVSASTIVPEAPANFKASASSIKVPSFDLGGGGGIPEFPDPIDLSWDNTVGEYYQVAVVNIESDPELINDTDDDRPMPNFSNSPEQTNSYELGFQSFSYYGNHRVILYRVNAEYVSLTRSTSDNSQNLSAPYTNVTNGLGIFTGVGADTLNIKVTK
jgi:hypothetical protein